MSIVSMVDNKVLREKSKAGGVILTIATIAIASCAYIFGQGERFQTAPIEQE